MGEEPRMATISEFGISSSIENEIPTYRAISQWAIASVLLGLVATFTFANFSFLIAAILAIVTGGVALRMISRYPDLLTGQRLANLGIALGLICGLSATTMNVVQGMVLDREVRAFAATYADTLQNGEFADILFLQAPPTRRSQTTPAAFLESTQSQMGPEFEIDNRTTTLRTLKTMLSRSEQEHVDVVAVESKGFSGLTPRASVVLALEGPEADKDPANKYIQVFLRGEDVKGKRDWYVDSLNFPYQVGSSLNVVESAHGHSH